MTTFRVVISANESSDPYFEETVAADDEAEAAVKSTIMAACRGCLTPKYCLTVVRVVEAQRTLNLKTQAVDRVRSCPHFRDEGNRACEDCFEPTCTRSRYAGAAP